MKRKAGMGRYPPFGAALKNKMKFYRKILLKVTGVHEAAVIVTVTDESMSGRSGLVTPPPPPASTSPFKVRVTV